MATCMSTVGVQVFQMAKRSDGSSGETLLIPCANEEDATQKLD